MCIRDSLNTDLLIKNALSKRMDLIEAQLQISIGIIEEKVSKNNLLPDLSLIYEYGNATSGYSFNDTFKSIGDNERPSRKAGFQFSYALGNRGAKARREKAALNNKIYLNCLKQKELRIKQEVLDAVDNLTKNWQLINAADQEMGLSKKIYEGEIEQFKLNLRTSTEVLYAAQFYTDAKVRKIQAISSFEISKVELAYVTGTQLGLSLIHI